MAPGSGSGRIVAEKFSGAVSAVRYFVTDHLGSTAVVTDESGNVVERDSYGAWGRRRNTDGSADPACALTSLTTRGFTGQIALPDVALYDYKARMYDPGIGRFLQTDPLGYGSGLNLYAYAGDDPVNATTGFFSFSCRSGRALRRRRRSGASGFPRPAHW